MAKRWQYVGDVNLEYGGLYFKESGHSDHVYAVQIVPASDMGGPDNLFCVETGSIFISDDPKRHSQALDCIGETLESATRLQLVIATNAYGGFDDRDSHWVQLGKAEDDYYPGFDMPRDIEILRGNTRLKNHVRREFLHD